MLVAVVFWCSAGFVVWSCARDICYRYARSCSHNCKTEKLIVSAEELSGSDNLVWMEHDELRYKNRMFDVTNVSIVGDSAVLTGHYDDMDETLLDLLVDLLEDEDDEHSNDFPAGKAKWAAECIIEQPYNYLFFAEPVQPDFAILSHHCWQTRMPEVPFNPPRT